MQKYTCNLLQIPVAGGVASPIRLVYYILVELKCRTRFGFNRSQYSGGVDSSGAERCVNMTVRSIYSQLYQSDFNYLSLL